MSTDTLKYSDWVKVTRWPTAYRNLRPDAHVGKVIYVTEASSRADVRLYTSAGSELATVTIGLRSLRKVDAPNFNTVLGQIPNTAEVQQFRDIVYATAMRYKTEHGLCSVLERSLEELGIEKPPMPKAKVKVEFELEVEIDRLVPGVFTEEDFDTYFGKWDRPDQVRAVINQTDYNTAKLEYKVLPAVQPEIVTVEHN